MPGYNRAELNAELTIIPSREAENSPQSQIEVAKQAASDSGLAREAGPETTVLTGRRSEVLEAVRRVIDASLDAGAHVVQVRVEAEAEATRFQVKS
jgi:uncharacterized protein YqgV (UPF0045/DUF77 family)